MVMVERTTRLDETSPPIFTFPFLGRFRKFGIALLRVSITIQHNPEKHSLDEELVGFPKLRPRAHLGPLGEVLDHVYFKSMV